MNRVAFLLYCLDKAIASSCLLHTNVLCRHFQFTFISHLSTTFGRGTSDFSMQLSTAPCSSLLHLEHEDCRFLKTCLLQSKIVLPLFLARKWELDHWVEIFWLYWICGHWLENEWLLDSESAELSTLFFEYKSVYLVSRGSTSKVWTAISRPRQDTQRNDVLHLPYPVLPLEFNTCSNVHE
jgi:hypothetical protein